MEDTARTLSKKAGLPPGTLVHIGKRRAENVRITVIDYDEQHYQETECKSPEECFPFKDKKTVSWINIDGLHEPETIQRIGNHFGLHPLLLEEILNTMHRPKLEDFESHIFLTLKMLGINKKGTSIVTEQVSMVLGDGWLLTFQERQGDLFDSFRQRLREGKAAARKRGPDYLLYRLMDTIVDNYYFVIEHFNDSIERLEEQVLQVPDQGVLHELQRLKRLLISFRRSVSPLREVVGTLQKDGNKLIQKGTERYLHDVYEHIIQLNDHIEAQRDMLGGIMDLYHSGVSNKMNQVMQVLTIISTIFIPLTFIAGIYGMNFEHMPELGWMYGYFGVLGLMVIVVIIMVLYFKKKRWL